MTEIQLLELMVQQQQQQTEVLSVIAGFIAAAVLAFGFCKLLP